MTRPLVLWSLVTTGLYVVAVGAVAALAGMAGIRDAASYTWIIGGVVQLLWLGRMAWHHAISPDLHRRIVVVALVIGWTAISVVLALMVMVSVWQIVGITH